MRLARWQFVAVALLATLAGFEALGQGRGQLTLSSSSQNVFIPTNAMAFSTAQGSRFSVTAFRAPTPFSIDIIADDDQRHTSVRMFFQAAENGWLGPGTYENAANFGGSRGAVPTLGFSGGCDGFGGEAGSFTVNEAVYELRPNTSFNVLRFSVSFRMHCVNPGGGEIVGSFQYVNQPEQGNLPFDPTGLVPGTGDGSGPGDDPGDDPDDPGDDPGPPVTPPPPLQIVLPPALAIDPVSIDNSGQQTITISTAVDSTFNSDVQLSVISNAAENEDFHVDITPGLIPAPGAGNATLKVRTGPLTFPRDYIVTLFATAGGEVTTSSFVVRVQCTPPFILGIDQPKSVSGVLAGTQTTLEVKAGGSGPFFYQWYRGVPGMTGSPVLAETSSKLIFSPRESGPYWVRVRNACGSVDSTPALVNVTPQPPTKQFSRRGSHP